MSDNNHIAEPIINSPYDEPKRHWKISLHKPPELINERRKATYYYTQPRRAKGEERPSLEIQLWGVTKIRERLAEWRELALQGGGGVTRVTMELMNHWRREGRQHRLFFAQLEAAETIIFLNEARPDFLQGIEIPPDEPGEERAKAGYTAFKRLCCKLATGGGKTTVMAMLAAWSILNKVANKTDGRYSAAVLVVCPNVTIRDRLAELNPKLGEASIYWTRDLIPQKFRQDIKQGKVFATNWHVFEEKVFGGAGSVSRQGKPVEMRETIYIGDKAKTARGRRYLPEKTLRHKILSGEYRLLREHRDSEGALVCAEIVWHKNVETDAALTRRALNKELGSASNIMVFNDEAHHAYRLRYVKKEEEDREEGEEEEFFADSALGEDSQIAQYYKEATVWIDGLDKIHKQLGINQCVDFSATPYFLGKAGKDTGRCFPWTVSNFGLHDAIEAGLVKIPQLAARDNTGATIPGYFNLWEWINRQITASERGGKKSEANPAAILKHANAPIGMLGATHDATRKEWEEQKKTRPPVFILVCKTTALAKVVYEWLAENKPPIPAIPSAPLPALRNIEGKEYTVRIDSKVQQEIESGNAKNDEGRWMRFVLDTVGKTEWRRDSQGRNILPKGFKELAKKLGREKFLEYPPGRDIRCIVSVGMLTEGWDCNTVTHIVGLRPFMSQLLCEQVVGRGLRRESYKTRERESEGETLELMDEEIASVIGVPLTLYPIKATNNLPPKQEKPKFRIHAVEEKTKYAITFPRVEGYRQKPRPLLQCNVDNMAKLTISPNDQIPRAVELAAGFCDTNGKFTPHVPGETTELTLEEFRRRARLQGELFQVAKKLTEELREGKEYALPANSMFAQVFAIVLQYVERRVRVEKGAHIKDIYIGKYYERLIENLRDGISAGGVELPIYERDRDDGKTDDVDFFTRREPYPIVKSHINALVPDTKKFEQSAGYALDNCPQVAAFVKNEGLGFAIAYTQGGVTREYMPDFIVRLQNDVHLVLETKQAPDDYKDKKKEAAERWAKAVTADGAHGVWRYAMVDNVADIDAVIGKLCPPSAA